jgi:hypothetical protein
MSHAIDQADELRKRAIEILLTERATIDERLVMLSYDMAGAPNSTLNKRRACGICGSPDHNARRCPKNVSNGSQSEPTL